MLQRKERELKSMVRDVKFRNVGPVTMSGRVVDIDANPADPTEFYVAYATGGLWHTVNNGLSFTPIFDNNDHLFMGDIAVDWKTRTIWVGTGEVNSSRSTYAGTGVFKTTNNGKNWEYLGLPESHHIGKIVLHPTDANTAWVAAMGHLYSFNKERGVYKTTDGGKTWKKVLFIDEKTGVIDVEIDPLNPNNLYAAAWYRTRTAWNFEEGGASSGLYKSTDGGATWTLCGTAASGFPATATVGRIGLAVYPKDPKIIYAIVDNQGKKEPAKKDSATINSRLTLRDFKNLTKEQFAALEDKKVDSFLKQNRFPAGNTAATIKNKVSDGSYKPSVIYDYLKGPNDDLLDASAIIGCEIYRSDDAGATWKKTNAKSLDGM
ncbi:MAG: glycosyl hydrolase, partial [Sphingobacteriales bacterium]